MARGACTFRERDAKRLIKAVREAGIDIERVEVDRDGKIAVITKGKNNQAHDQQSFNEWDVEFNGSHQAQIR